MKEKNSFMKIRYINFITAYIILFIVSVSACVLIKCGIGSDMSDVTEVLIIFLLSFAVSLLFFSIIAGIVFGILALVNLSIQMGIRKKNSVHRKLLKLKLMIIFSVVYVFSLIFVVAMNLGIR